jgi:CDP-glycerol glycerophosphotransferase
MSKSLPKIKNIIVKIIVRIFNCFPIKNNKIFLFSYYGSQYGCNPKYISEYIVKNCPGKFDIVWAFNDVLSKEHIQGVRKVKVMTLKYFYELCTSRVIITNFRTTDVFKKRKNQYYIQTWHSSLRLKQIEKDAEYSLPENYVKMAQEDSKKCDLLLSGCGYSTDIFKRAFWYNGEIFEHGTPRNDLLARVDEQYITNIKNKINIPKDVKLVLYAPTFRKNNDLEVYKFDYKKVLNSLKSRFGGDWRFCVKLHPHLISKSEMLDYDNDVLNLTKYDDVQELLAISDVLISDYSSLMFDFGLTKRPCFLYVPDLEEYINQDRKLYFDIEQLPFISTRSSTDLINKIEMFDNEKYNKELNTFLNSINSFENGNSCEKLVERIKEVCFKLCKYEKI